MSPSHCELFLHVSNGVFMVGAGNTVNLSQRRRILYYWMEKKNLKNVERKCVVDLLRLESQCNWNSRRESMGMHCNEWMNWVVCFIHWNVDVKQCYKLSAF